MGIVFGTEDNFIGSRHSTSIFRYRGVEIGLLEKSSSLSTKRVQNSDSNR